jgi:hypothetical protein
MCFSATASFIAGGALSAAGIATLRRAGTKSRVAFASIPLLFGIQQLIEGFVWISFGHPILQSAAASLYAMFSHVLWPFFLPLSIALIETDPRRRRILTHFVFFGLAVSLYLLFHVVNGPVTVSIVQKCLAYHVPNPDSPLVLAAYLIATCVSCQFSSHKFVRVFGVTLFAALLIALWSYRYAFYSVWCFFAAILSLIIYVQLGEKEKAAVRAAYENLKARMPSERKG